MLGSHVLETVIGLAFIYLILATFASAISEWISALLSFRAKDLLRGMKNLLGEDPSQTPGKGQAMATALMAHPLIQNLSAPKLLGKGVSSPAYVEAKVFSAALLDLLVPDQGEKSLTAIRLSVSGLANQDL